MIKRLFCISAIVSVALSCNMTGASSQVGGRHDNDVRLELPAYSGSEQVLEHLGYTTSYNSETLNPDWVAYELTSSEVQGDLTGKSSFRWDPMVKGRKSWREDYRNDHDWDKGHMAPKADMKWSVQAYEESFYLSNICPQNHQLNSGDWAKTEHLARRMAEKHGKVYIVCGPVFKDRKHGTLGENKVWIPDGFFKALLIPVGSTYESIGFYMSNEPQKNNIRTYACSVDDIEKMISRDLFPALDDAVEPAVESGYRLRFWGL